MKHHNPGFLAIVNDAKTRIEEIDVPAYLALRQSGETHILVDVREESEFAAGHVKGAVHLGKGVIERDIETAIPDKTRKLILYCGEFSFRAGGGQPSENGLYDARESRRRLAGAQRERD